MKTIILTFPNDILTFGKHKGKTIGWVIDNDKPYFEWIKKGNFLLNSLLFDYANGTNIIKEKIKSNFIKKTGVLNVFLCKYYRSAHIYGVRKSHEKQISQELIQSYQCYLPISIKKWTEHIDCTKFHNDSIEVEKVDYVYNQKDLDTFIQSKLDLHKQLNHE